MPDGVSSDACDAAETILTALHKARYSTLLRGQPLKDGDIYADPAEGLPLMCAFARIEDPALRGMITRVVEMLAAAPRHRRNAFRPQEARGV